MSLSGLSLQYASATGTAWDAVALAGAIPAGGYFLVQLAAGNGNGVALPAPDLASASIDLLASAGKVALLQGVATVPAGACPPAATTIDLVGFGEAPRPPARPARPRRRSPPPPPPFGSRTAAPTFGAAWRT